MTVNEQGPRNPVAGKVEAAARTLARSTGTIPNPAESYALLGELYATTGHLAQVCQQLATWHENAAVGTHYRDQRDRGEDATRGSEYAAAGLRRAAAALVEATEALLAAQSGNSVVSWYVREPTAAGDHDHSL